MEVLGRPTNPIVDVRSLQVKHVRSRDEVLVVQHLHQPGCSKRQKWPGSAEAMGKLSRVLYDGGVASQGGIVCRNGLFAHARRPWVLVGPSMEAGIIRYTNQPVPAVGSCQSS